MKISKFLQFILVLGVLFMHTVACSSLKKSKNTDPEAKILGTWQVKSIEQNGRTIDIEKIAGETFMEFYTFEKKDKEGKKIVTYKYKMEMGGSDRMFDFKLVNDSIQFQKVKGWNDMKIIDLNRAAQKLIVQQHMDGNLIFWNMILRADMDEAKAKQKKQQKKSK